MKALARAGDPYVTPSGEIIEPDGVEGKELKAKFKPSKRRTMKEMPAPPQILNAVACVFLYTLMGVGEREIAESLKITAKEVRDVRKMPAYTECFDAIANEFINANSELIGARIAAYSHDALTSVAQIAVKGKNEGNRLRAGQDLLDRAGHGPKESVAKRMMTSNELRIVVIDNDKQVGVQISGV